MTGIACSAPRQAIRHVQELLGHADLDTTRIYLRLLPEKLRADYEAAMPELLATRMIS